MWKLIKSGIATLAAVVSGAAWAQQAAGPPVDLNRPVQNPALVAALTTLEGARTPENAAKVRKQLQRAVFLVPILTDEFHTTKPSVSGQSTVLENSRLKVFLAPDSSGKSFVPLFTDWDEIKKWTKKEVNTWVMPAADAWAFVLSNAEFAGIVINPGGTSLPLSRGAVEQLSKGQ
jgi:hypothetical protein